MLEEITPRNTLGKKIGTFVVFIAETGLELDC